MSRASPHHFQLEHLKTVHEKGMAVADPDLELRVGGRGARFGLLTLLAFLSSVISSIFIQNEGEGGGGPSGPLSLDPPLHGNNWCCQLNISQTIRNGNKWGKYWHSICKYMTQIKRC